MGERSAEGERLKRHGIRATRPRLEVLNLMRQASDRHVTSDSLYREAMERKLPLSLATIYNTLHQFAAAGLVRRVDVAGRMVFCTDPKEHHHFIEETSGKLVDIPSGQPQISGLPQPPDGWEITGIDVLVRIRPKARVV